MIFCLALVCCDFSKLFGNPECKVKYIINAIKYVNLCNFQICLMAWINIVFPDLSVLKLIREFEIHVIFIEFRFE